MKIDGFTVQEIANTLGISYKTAHKRLQRAGIEPITTGAIYPKSSLDAIRDASIGRPKKPKDTKPADSGQ